MLARLVDGTDYRLSTQSRRSGLAVPSGTDSVPRAVAVHSLRECRQAIADGATRHAACLPRVSGHTEACMHGSAVGRRDRFSTRAELSTRSRWMPRRGPGARVGARVRLCALEYNTSIDLNVRRNVARKETWLPSGGCRRMSSIGDSLSCDSCCCMCELLYYKRTCARDCCMRECRWCAFIHWRWRALRTC
jgi:hypothetical protein